jgi:catechol 2,3-dioxygenase-like lactoylglutathione lyase family enzyme
MSPLEITKSVPVAFHGVTPVLRVNDLEASLDYYVGVLGFKMNWRDDDGNSFASVSRGQCHLFLSVDDQGNPGSWMWIGVRKTRMAMFFVWARIISPASRLETGSICAAFAGGANLRATGCGWSSPPAIIQEPRSAGNMPRETRLE